MSKLHEPLPLLDVTATHNTWGYWARELVGIVRQFKPVPGRGLRVRVDVVDTRELEACEENDD